MRKQESKILGRLDRVRKKIRWHAISARHPFVYAIVKARETRSEIIEDADDVVVVVVYLYVLNLSRYAIADCSPKLHFLLVR